MEILEATTPERLESARMLFREYQGSLGIDLGFQGFEREVAGLPGAYAPPRGRLYIAVDEGTLVGCVALRPLGETPMGDAVCEMKRLYLRPEARGRGASRLLVATIVGDARTIGYEVMRLDTLPPMKAAMALYRTLGFVEVAPYYVNPVEGTLFMELRL